MSRTVSTAKNLVYSYVGQGVSLLFSFAVRIVFIRTLGAEYLGLTGVFSSVLTMLSLAELGLGTAAFHTLYAPVAAGDMKRISVLVRFYRRCYFWIGAATAALGLVVMPLLPLLISDWPVAQENLYFIYAIFLFNAVASYFFTARRTLLIVSQKTYLISLFHYGTLALCSALQALLLIATRNYLLYLLCTVLQGLTENLLIGKKAAKLYPDIDWRGKAKPDKVTFGIIVKDTVAGFSNKIGGVVVTGTDSILIASFVGIAAVGIYSNYKLVASIISSVLGQVLTSVTASVGNLAASASVKKQMEVFDTMNLFCLWAFGFCSVCLFVLMNPFIALCFGPEFVLGQSVVAVAVLNFYLFGLRQSGFVFSSAKGLYWYSRYKPLAEALLNLVLSIVLGLRYGIFGVLLATSISTLSVAYWVEAVCLYRFGFHARVGPYFRRHLLGTAVLLLSLLATLWVCSALPCAGLLQFVLQMAACVVVPNLFFYAVFGRTREFLDLQRRAGMLWGRICSRRERGE